MFKIIRRALLKETEAVDPVPHSASLGIVKPPSLDELVARAVRAEIQRNRAPQQFAAQNDALDFDSDDAGDEFGGSPHETHFDSRVGREITRAEAAFLDNERKAFDSYVTEVKKKAKKKEPASPANPIDPKKVEA